MPRLPNDSQRQLTIGGTGSGKTTFAAYTLARRSYTRMPWIIANFKDDELINEIPAIELDGFKLPSPKKFKPGIYIIRPTADDYDDLEELMQECWKRTHIGIYFDELLEISQPKHPAYRKLLTQGRSRKVPVIGCTQRPVDIDRYSFSESEFITVMKLNDERDADKVYDMTGVELNMRKLPKFYSYAIERYDSDRKVSVIPPVPSPDTIIDIFNQRLKVNNVSYFI